VKAELLACCWGGKVLRDRQSRVKILRKKTKLEPCAPRSQGDGQLAAFLLGPHCMARSLFGLSRRRTPFLHCLLARLVFLLDSFPDSLSCFFIHNEDYTDLIGLASKVAWEVDGSPALR
jgi:hypothetical protein